MGKLIRKVPIQPCLDCPWYWEGRCLHPKAKEGRPLPTCPAFVYLVNGKQ